MNIQKAIEKAVLHTDLTEREMEVVFNDIMNGRTTEAQIGAFITALRMKGETVEEITGAARVMRQKALKVHVAGAVVDIDRDDINIESETILDTCGTGGSGTNTFNISTTVAFVLAACGVKVAKHGNRSVSSQCGSADVLERLGVSLDSTPEEVAAFIRNAGIGFLYAPLYHGAMKYAVKPRREIGIRTIFNVLGPLSNPAGASRQIVGVYTRELVPIIARVLKRLGTQKAFVVHGMDTLDEITITGKTFIAELKGARIRTFFVTPADFGLKRSTLASIRGGTAEENARIVAGVLKGNRGAPRDVVLMNASAGLMVAGKAHNFKKGVTLAGEAIDSGRAWETFRRLKEMAAKA
ncbi:MAG: anthranilate phosphoribosyltransferase [Candidatus Omnitrophica bacterium]|nr:anthranilate phosphoribosyltransferase [Candidatus Omnitrophota bacterium]